MAFLLELIPIIAEAVTVGGEAAAAGGEIAVAGGEVATAATEVAATGGEVAAAGGEIAATGGEVAGATETTIAETGTVAGETGSTAVSTVSKVPVFDMTASGTTAGAQAAHTAIFEGAVAFAKWAAIEAAKQAVFYGGMKAAEAAFHAVADALKTPESQALSAKLTKLNDAASTLNSITTDWLSWSKSHYDDRSSYGSVTVLRVSVTRYEVLQNNLGSLGDELNAKVAPPLLAFNKSKTAADLETLRVAMVNYATKVKSQSDSIKANEQTMVAAGLQDHQADIASALSNLS
ncbi:hypothetical protein ABW19_dt0206920 [Dactylella cylindrospora]|nr:hypothetical protein ABW19_dt0206920 [Dactylella cylindrospora]